MLSLSCRCLGVLELDLGVCAFFASLSSESTSSIWSDASDLSLNSSGKVAGAFLRQAFLVDLVVHSPKLQADAHMCCGNSCDVRLIAFLEWAKHDKPTKKHSAQAIEEARLRQHTRSIVIDVVASMANSARAYQWMIQDTQPVEDEERREVLRSC